MITEFGTLWDGQVHHGEIGFGAPAVDDRWCDDAHLASPATAGQIARLECWQPVVSISERGIDVVVGHGIKAFIGGEHRVAPRRR